MAKKSGKITIELDKDGLSCLYYTLALFKMAEQLFKPDVLERTYRIVQDAELSKPTVNAIKLSLEEQILKNYEKQLDID
jgi:hypothetical protein